MASTFVVHKAAGYEQLMGRWSRRLAEPFIRFAGLADGERVADIGCGTGILSFALAQAANVTEIAAIDLSPVFVEYAKARNTDPRLHFEQGDAQALPFADRSFDRALSLLVLHFVPEPGKAVAEMRRVVRPGGIVAAAVWDHLGGLGSMRMFWDSVAMLSERGRQARGRYFWQPMMQQGELAACFSAQGLVDVVQESLTIRMDYADFADYWAPMAGGEGPIGGYVSGLDAAEREAVATAMRDAYEGGRADGPRSFAAVAWACRGRVSEAGSGQ